MNGGHSDAPRADAGAAVHHWVFAIVVGAAAGAVEVLTAWILIRVLF